MKKLLFSFVLVAGLSTAALAAVDHPLELSLQGGGVFPQDENRIDNTTAFGGIRLTYDVAPAVAIGAEADWINFKDEPGGVKSGTIYSMPMLGVIEFKMPIAKTVVPYVIAGAGVAYWHYREGSVLKASGADVDNEWSFAAKGGVGVDFFVTPNTAVFLEGSYFWSRYKPKDGGAFNSGKLKMDSILAGGGVKFAF